MEKFNLKNNIERLILFFLSLCIGVMPLLYFPYDKFSLIPHRIDVIFKPKQNFLIVVEIILLILFAIYFRVNKFKFKLNKISVFLISFYLILMLSTLFSDYKHNAVFGRPFRLEGLIAYLTYILLFFMIYIYVDNEKKVRVMIYSLIISATIISIYGIMQFYNIDPIYKDPYLITGIYQNRAFSTLGNPVFAGSYASMLFSLIFTLFFLSKDSKKYKLGALTVIFFAFLMSTSSKAAIIGVVFSLFFLLYISKDKILLYKKKLSYLLIILVFICVMMELTGKPITPLKRFSNFFVEMIKKKPNTQLIKSEINIKRNFFYKKDFSRIHIYTKGIKLLLKNPLLGSGPDTFDKVFPQQKGFRLLDKAHSEYIQIGVTTGLPSLIIYLLFIYNLLKVNFYAIKQRNLYQIATFIAYLIQAIFSISVVSVAPIFWGLMGLNLAIIRNNNRLNE